MVSDGKLSVAGIVQEQHPDRAALYMQWQQMDWPVLADPFNDLGISAVPITLLIDEHGVIRYRNPKPNDLKKFLDTEYTNDAKKKVVLDLSEKIGELEQSVTKNSKDARSHFRLGVAYRMRFDSDDRKDQDFAKAMSHWEKALELNLNQYIWRRRIQQYGPRLDKPYSFYDWVTKARADIKKRGEKPVVLSAEPSGAEFAIPARAKKQGEDTSQKHPDPDGKVSRDAKNLVSNRVVVVSSTNRKKSAVRVHLTLSPASATAWTNDAGNVSFHLDGASGVKIQDLKIPQLPKQASSNEARVIEFEVHPQAGQKLPEKITGAVFYYVCTKTDDTCQFLRQDIEIQLGR